MLRAQLVHIGGVIRSRRQERSWPIQQLADCAGLSAAMVSLVERGLAAPSLASLTALADCLGLRLVDLFAAADRQSADGVSADGMSADGVSAAGVLVDGVIADGVSAAGVLVDGVTADGVIADGVIADGVIADGVTADGVIADGAGTRRRTSADEHGTSPVAG